jgi:hypothetical protein
MDEKRKKSLNMNSLEENLPFYLWNDIQLLIDGREKKVLHLDCIFDELDSDFHSARMCREISGLQETYLKKKYLEEASEEELQLWFEKRFKN